MIIGGKFEGDDDTEVMWMQHEFYGKARGQIIQTCNRLTLFARTILKDRLHPEWGMISACDHRTLQDAHDIIAAAWRFRYDLRQAELPLDRNSKYKNSRTPEGIWYDWLRTELEGWLWDAQLIRDVQLILENQNKPKGYAAEARLSLGLLSRFRDVPWRSNLHTVYEKKLECYIDADAGESW